MRQTREQIKMRKAILKTIDALVRDFSKVHPAPKSEIRRRLFELMELAEDRVWHEANQYFLIDNEHRKRK